MRKFCVVCGREEETVKLLGSICVQCYPKVKELVYLPSEVRVRYCKVCRAAWRRGKWGKENENLLHLAFEEALRRVQIDPWVTEISTGLESGYKDATGALKIRVKIEGKVEESTFVRYWELRVLEEQDLCDRCRKLKGRSYEAIVQLRGQIGEDEKRVFEVIVSKDALYYLAEVKQVRDGYDYYFTNASAARRVVGAFSKFAEAKVKESHEGEKLRGGKRKSKLVISVRI